jgi:hypothetical protein
MSTTLHLLALDEKNLTLFLAAQEAELAYWTLISGENIEDLPATTVSRVTEAYAQTGDAWHEARVAMGRGERLPLLEASHRDTEPCELTALFAAEETFTLTVTDENIQELADAWEASNRKRTFSMARGKGTVMGWLMDHRGQTITLGS